MSTPTSQSSPTACRLLQPGETFTGKQGLQYAVGISAESEARSTSTCSSSPFLPEDGPAPTNTPPTRPPSTPSPANPACGTASVSRHHTIVRPGDFFYIPADVPHLPYNPSTTEPVVAVIARTDPNEQESVVLLPELDNIHPTD